MPEGTAGSRNNCIMKKFILIVLALIGINSCIKEEPNGKWHPVKVDEDSWNVTGAGADIVVELLNYSSWWIDCAYGEKDDYDHYIWPSSSNERYDSDILDGGWLYAQVPHDEGKPRLEVWVGANEGGEERDAYIQMSCGDVGKTIHIHQGAQNGFVIRELVYSGWDDVFNDLKEPVTIQTLYNEDPEYYGNKYSKSHIIEPGSSVRLVNGSFVPGESIREHNITLITLADGRQMKFLRDGNEAWNRAFLDSYTEETFRERVEVEGIWTNHIYTTRVYRINQDIVTLWGNGD